MFSKVLTIQNLISLIMVFSGFLVAFSINPIQSVLFLITTFFSGGLLLILFHSEFFGLAFIIVYVGAIAVLFLFVIMMLNIKNIENLHFFFQNRSLEIVTLLFLFYFIFVFLMQQFYGFFVEKTNNNEVVLYADQLSNIQILGQVLYNYYYICFLVAGLLLLIGLVGATVLTLKFKELNKGQLPNKQLARSDKFLTFF